MGNHRKEDRKTLDPFQLELQIVHDDELEGLPAGSLADQAFPLDAEVETLRPQVIGSGQAGEELRVAHPPRRDPRELDRIDERLERSRQGADTAAIVADETDPDVRRDDVRVLLVEVDDVEDVVVPVLEGQLQCVVVDDESLAGYDVLVLPHGYYDSSTFSDEFVKTLKGWVSRGGTLVCLGGASRWAANPDLDLSAVRMRDSSWPPTADEAQGDARTTRSIPGAILRAVPDPHHYLTFGYTDDTPVLVNSNSAFEPSSDIAAPLQLAPVETLRLSGFAYRDSLERLAETPYVMDERVGEGHIVMFLDDPNFRLYWRGLSRLFLNAVLLSPSF